MTEDPPLVIVLEEGEQPLDLPGDAPVSRQQGEVAEHTRRGLVEVACSHVRIVPLDAAFLARNEQELGMRLKAGHPEDDLDARLLQGLRDLDVVALVEPRLELDHHLHLLAVERGAGERVDDVRILCHPIEVDPDGLDFRINRRLPQQVHQLGKGVIGIMEQDVPPRNLLEIAGAALQVPVRQRPELAVDQSRPSEVGEIHQVLAVVVPAPGDDARLVHHAQLSNQELQQLLRHGPVVQEAHIVTLLPAGDAFSHLLEQGLGEVVVHVNLGVPRHLDGIG